MFYTYAYFRFKRLHSCAKTFKSFDFQSFDYKSVSDEGYYSNVPDEGYYSNVPDEGYYSNVPDEGYSRNASCALKLDIYVFIGIYFT